MLSKQKNKIKEKGLKFIPKAIIQINLTLECKSMEKENEKSK
jgi:hypothetical protein